MDFGFKWEKLRKMRENRETEENEEEDEPTWGFREREALLMVVAVAVAVVVEGSPLNGKIVDGERERDRFFEAETEFGRIRVLKKERDLKMRNNNEK